MSRFLGIDLGTTFFKGAVLDLDARTLLHISRVPAPSPVTGLPANRHELSPDSILAAVRTLLSELLAAAADAAGLVVSSQMHGLAFTDEIGRPNGNVVTWKDQRGLDPHPSGNGSDFDQLCRRLTPEQRRELGGEVRVGVPVSTLFSMNERGRLAAHRGQFAASLPDFVLANLWGVEPTTEPTLASAHGLYHHDALRWHGEVIDELGLSGLRFPRIRPARPWAKRTSRAGA